MQAGRLSVMRRADRWRLQHSAARLAGFRSLTGGRKSAATALAAALGVFIKSPLASAARGRRWQKMKKRAPASRGWVMSGRPLGPTGNWSANRKSNK